MLALSLAGFALVALLPAHGLLCRRALGIGAINALIAAMLLVGTTLVAAYLFLHVELSEAVGGVLVYIGGVELYGFLMTLSLASIGANISVLLADGPVDKNTLEASYDEHGMAELRIIRLSRVGYVVDSQTIAITPAGAAWARRFAWFASVMGVR